MDQNLIAEFSALLECEGVRSIASWTLPNNDAPFDEDAALADFQANLDASFDATSTAIAAIGAEKSRA